MKVRIKFSKQGPARFIGHLDVMRYFQKVMRRADVSIHYSGGFSPHQIMSFAAPLGVGITSMGEYLDIEVDDTEDLATMKRRMNETMAEGFHVESCRRLPDDAGNAMSIVAAAEYTIAFRPGYEPEDPEMWMKGLEAFYGQDQILITKKTKKGEKELDLKALVYEIHAEGPSVRILISTGSSENIKPELVLDAYYQKLGEERPAFAFLVQREEVFAGNSSQKGGPRFLPLELLGETIE
ncbi:MAG: TIGR03936 family radical SAM-associated protein [Lachnospiraceae bacterium]|nr:TIGR03936 family radical SAM-associated protein [Lachnospiraceae bacterium]